MAFKDGGTVKHIGPGPGTAVSGPGGHVGPPPQKAGQPPPNPMPSAAGPHSIKPKGGPSQPAGQPTYNQDDD